MLITECVTYDTWYERSPRHSINYIEKVTYLTYLGLWAVTIMSKHELA